MQFFVESHEPVLRHRSGVVSLGFPAVCSRRGDVVPYKSHGRFLYVHSLEVEPICEEDLGAWFDPVAERTINGRRSPSGADWWLSRNSTAYALVELSTGTQRDSARLGQLKNPVTVTVQ